MEGNGWSEYQKLVLFRLDAIEDELKALRNDVLTLRLKVALISAAVSAPTGALIAYFAG